VIRVLIADDHAVVRRGLREILNDADDIVVEGEASTGQEAIQLVAQTRFDIVVLDINLPGASGLEVLTEIRRVNPSLPVLILTMYSESQYAVRAMRSGAAGFLTKDSAPTLLVEAVRKISAGGRYVSSELGERLAAFVASEDPGEPHERLSNRELEVLKLLAAGLTVSQVAERLTLSVKTVSTHRARLLAKMEMKTNAELTRYAVQHRLVD
jgi:DNA-binding NarL/FixJ family response regulator